MKFLTLMLLLGFSRQVMAFTPPGYPKDADWIAPQTENIEVFKCYGAPRHAAKKLFGNVSYSECVELALDYRLTETNPTWDTVESCQEYTGQITFYCTFSSSDEHHHGTTPLTRVGEYVPSTPILSTGCFQEPYQDGYDIDGDGEIDRCYNPADTIKERVTVPTACKFDAYTPSTDDENAIKSATSKALELMESMEAALRNPSAANACQLNGLATLMGMPDYTHPHFGQLSDSILSRFEAIKPRLQSASNDLSSDPEIRYLVADAVTALRKRFSGVVCARADGSDLLYDESTLRYAYIPDKFIGGAYDIRDTIIHETHHTVGGEHDELDSFSNHRKAFETMIVEYGKYATRQPNASAKRIFTTMTNNPHNLVWMMEALQCQ